MRPSERRRSFRYVGRHVTRWILATGLGYVYTYSGLFDYGYFLLRIGGLSTRIYPEVSHEHGARIRSFSKTLSEVDLSKTEVSDRDLFCLETVKTELRCACCHGGNGVDRPEGYMTRRALDRLLTT